MKYYLAKAKKDLIADDGDHSFIIDKTYICIGDDYATTDKQGYKHTLGDWLSDFELEEIDKETYNLIINL